ncbi:hypothetical protein DTO164E3_8706 [Paecilomyces variotii]|nr:hypothetical protein DTO164E3_8706 [Paecilomyces variotii]KAJ9286963.1 hypothetical protein DTO021C3_5483 [Paecilomyces variotii]
MDQLLDVGRCEPELASAGGRQHNSRVQGDRERVEQHDPSVSARFESRDSDHHREPPFAVFDLECGGLAVSSWPVPLVYMSPRLKLLAADDESCRVRSRVSQTDSCSRPEVYVSEGYDHTHAQ